MSITPKTLTHGDLIFAAAWGRHHTCRVATLRGYYADNNRPADVADRMHRYLRRTGDPSDPAVWATQVTHALTDTPDHFVAKQEQAARAVEVVDGEVVIIEAEPYRVKLMGKQHSDAIHFVPLDAEPTA